MANWETLKLEQDEETKGVYTLTLNRPKSMNALNTRMAEELVACLKDLKEQKDLRVLVVTGSGEKSFCVGADLKERNGMTNEDWRRQHDIFEEAYGLLRDFPFPVIAAVNGYALGGGMEMVLSCDLRIFAEHAKVGVPEVKIGIIPGVGGTQLLPRSIPVGLAKEILFRGNQVPAERAQEIGLANYVVPSEQLTAKVLEVARDIGKNAPLSLKALKHSINNGLQTDINTALNIELDQYYKCANSEDRLEGIRAFNEKRQPEWQGK
ncbi:enoyl-CoA hydratase/isomerase family protein [Salinibacillus xinjiangensis]|uniref:Enoyl-CoA hydratase n=1 Tax=Salinibacillus xinjiangensis TaxID=1229268 RepID=A0A6G1X1X2_9BACI|nr:enoyl-CoA hydratase-related protein [Salinibacillus xinjiangensis]MRG84828.1 enoyl-CoA hydratase [Salinibacillus xinjiangensis]